MPHTCWRPTSAACKRPCGAWRSSARSSMASWLPSLSRWCYETYTLQRAIAATVAAVARLASARLYVLVDGRSTPDEFAALAASLVAAAVDVIQLRDKGLDDRTLLARARQLREATAGSRTL